MIQASGKKKGTLFHDRHNCHSPHATARKGGLVAHEPRQALDGFCPGTIIMTRRLGFSYGGRSAARARLRTFLRACVDGMIASAERGARRQKRGGGRPILSLDVELAEGELSRTGIPSPDSPEDFFEKEWVRSLFSLAVQRLREE